MRSVFGVACGDGLAEGVVHGQVGGSVNDEGTAGRVRIDFEFVLMFTNTNCFPTAVGKQAALAVFAGFHALDHDITLVEHTLLAGVARHAGADVVDDPIRRC